MLEEISANVKKFTESLKEEKDLNKVIEFQSGMIESLIASIMIGDATLQKTLLEALNINR